jgi:hypothetical protein
MTINDKEMVLIAVIFVIVILRLYVNSLADKKKEIKVVPGLSCPGLNMGKMHAWEYDIDEGGHRCSICGKKAGSVE